MPIYPIPPERPGGHCRELHSPLGFGPRGNSVFFCNSYTDNGNDTYTAPKSSFVSTRDSGMYDPRTGDLVLFRVEHDDDSSLLIGYIFSINPISGAITFVKLAEISTSGFSPSIEVSDITGGHRVTVTNSGGSSTFDVMDGEKGDPFEFDDFTEEQLAGLREDVASVYTSKDEAIVTTVGTNTTSITIPFADWSGSKDMLLVYVEGLALTEGVDYAISGSSINLTSPITHEGTDVTFKRMITIALDPGDLGDLVDNVANRIESLITSGDLDATTSISGTMSAADKAKLDGIATGATKVSVTQTAYGSGASVVNFSVQRANGSYDMTPSAVKAGSNGYIEMSSIANGSIPNSKLETPYSLPIATTSTIGGVKPDGTTVTMDNDGTIHAAGQYTLPTMSASTKGGAMVGDGLAMTGDVLGIADGGVDMDMLSQDVQDAINVVDPEAIDEAVDAWLTEHPEATTTVQDGSITDPKLEHSSVVNPINWCDHDALTSGILNADGTVTEASNRVYTGFVPVTSGDVVRTYYRTNGMYMTNVCAYDADKQVISGEGRDSSGMTFTVGANTKFVRVTFDSDYIAKAMLTVNLVPTAYEDYFEPYYVLTKDYLTPQSQDVISGLVDKTLTSANLANRYGCALPRTELRQTVGLAQSWYLRNMATPATAYVYVGAGSLLTLGDGSYVTFPNAQASSSVNGFKWERYDAAMATIDSGLGPAGYGYECKVATENLSNCTMLVVGDSTVDQDVMTQALLTHFTAQGHTLTLLGTLGSGDNKNEGRAGWSARDYLTGRKYDGVTNPFYNPTSETFDFAYYMTNQGYSAPDFVVVQLGINDLYSTEETAIQPTWDAVKTIVDSIIAYDPAIKVILNLVTPPNSSQEVHSVVGTRLFMYHNRVVRYNDIATRQVLASYQSSRVRTSYCHLILDPATDIRDHVHPTDTGYEKMALEIVNQVNCWLN